MSSGQFTTLTRANNTGKSLRTTVPASIIKQFDLKEGDQLKWRFESNDNNICIKIEPVRSNRDGDA
jgi:antitoxin component of MazEF toxin-antitoxin module